MAEVVRAGTFDRWLTRLGGDKSTQEADIRKAHEVAAEWWKHRS
ncbi:hypothetical protein [Serinicoccus marinus]|nr:hypothetical protein [Serinicoccus marinus]